MSEQGVPLTQEQADALRIAQFILGWWPGLEDGISWGTGNDYERHPVYRAAARLHKGITGTDYED